MALKIIIIQSQLNRCDTCEYSNRLHCRGTELRSEEHGVVKNVGFFFYFKFLLVFQFSVAATATTIETHRNIASMRWWWWWCERAKIRRPSVQYTQTADAVTNKCVLKKKKIRNKKRVNIKRPKPSGTRHTVVV